MKLEENGVTMRCTMRWTEEWKNPKQISDPKTVADFSRMSVREFKKWKKDSDFRRSVKGE